MKMKMEKAKSSFEDYLTDGRLETEQRVFLRLIQEKVHEIYPEVVERVAYAMPCYFPVGAAKSNQMLFSFSVAEKWLTLGGTQGIPLDHVAKFQDLGVEIVGKRSIRLPYDLTAEPLTLLLKTIIDYNLERYGFK